MFEINPFAELSATVSVEVMQGFVTLMIALVAGGTLFDIDSESALLLLKWIQTGASSHQTRKLLRVELTPQRILLEDLTKSAPLHAKAVYSDGTTRDVTSWTVFTPEDATALTIDTDSYRLSAHRRGRHIATARFLTEVLPIEVLVLVPSFT